MSAAAPSWSALQQLHLQEQIVGFWAQDEWNMDECPLPPSRRKKPLNPARASQRKLHFHGLAPSLSVELKYACWQKFARGDWAPHSELYGLHIARIVNWLKQVAPVGASFLQSSLEQWEVSLRSYLLEHGKLRVFKHHHLDASQQFRMYDHPNPHLTLLHQIYALIAEAYDDPEKTEYEKDIWDLRKLGVDLNLSASAYRINFRSITLPWLRQAAKQFLRYELARRSASAGKNRMTALRAFSRFLDATHPHLEAEAIDRMVVIEYLQFLSSLHLAPHTRNEYVVWLRIFLDLCAREKWAAVPEKQLIYNDDFLRRGKAKPRFIPQEILTQLNEHLDALPAPIMRMLLILQECGLRIGELCTLPWDCLTQDASGDWFLRYYQTKMKKEHTIPLAREIVAVIQEQQQAVQTEWDQTIPWLFPNEKGVPIKQLVFVRALNRLAYEKGIRDTSGRPYHFQSHQFRHTVATRMINNGVPLHIVQKYLGHESPDMTAVYATIHDATMKEEYLKYRGKVVDMVGRVVVQEGQVNAGDPQWIKKNILAQALPHGTCALPLVAGDCPHANACLTCVHFRTNASFLPQIKAQLLETQKLIQVARANGWKRQVEMNERVEANLTGIIHTLEERQDPSC